MIPISKYILNRKQKRAAQRVARFLRLWNYWFLCLFYALFYFIPQTTSCNPFPPQVLPNSLG